MKRLLLVFLVFACDQKDDPGDAAAALSAIIPPPLPSETRSASAPTLSASHDAAAVDAGTFPLQAWMKKNMTPPMDAKDWAGLADALDRAATLAPPTSGYANWVSIAKDGANAARAAEMNAVKAACRGCHQQYKDKYRAEMRSRPVPP
jgi:hypothetical protein